MKKISALVFALILGLFTHCFAQTVSLEDMAGEMIILGFNGDSVDSKGFKQIISQIKDNKISGVIFFENNIKNREEFYKLTSAVYNSKMRFRPFISIDMEGGEIQRMNSGNGFKNFPSAVEISKGGLKKSGEKYSLMAEELQSMLINLNFAPCVDIDLNSESILHKKKRSYSRDPRKVSAYAETFIKAHFDKNIITSVKHFPGHGSVKGDTHLNFVDASGTFKEEELLPYKQLMNKNPLQMVMVSHIYNKKFDEIYPASLSNSTVTGLLRNTMGFNGIVITDDLDMGAVRENYKLDEIVIQAINAGCDILLFSNREHHNPNLAEDIHKIIQKAVIDGQISPQRIQESYDRITALKEKLILNEPKN